MLLDIDFYRKFYNEFENFSDDEIINHYKNYGINENRIYSFQNFNDIFPFFSLEDYIYFNKDLINFKTDIDYLKHFYFSGQFENRKYSINDFDIIFYKLFNKDLLFSSDKEYINHYLNYGINENRLKCKEDFYKLYPKNKHLKNINEMYDNYKIENKSESDILKDINPKFDIEFYKLFNKDLKFKNNNEIITHYLNNGIKEKRLTSINDFYELYSDFNINLYKYSDIEFKKFNDIDLMFHYHNFGKNENRELYKKIINNYQYFDIDFYKNFNKDLLFNNEFDIINHYINNSKKEKRFTSKNDFYELYPLFDVDIYKYYNNDLKHLDEIDLMYHYHNVGRNENRNYKYINNNDFFNIDIYKKFQNYIDSDDDTCIFKDYIKSKNKYIGNLSDFYSKFPDFNIKIYKAFYSNKNLITDNIIFNIIYNIVDFFVESNIDIVKLDDIGKLDDVDILYNFYKNDKSNVIYSLKTFYEKFPKFNYHGYRVFNNIKNIGEVDTIINWYLNDYNYNFIDNNIKSNIKNILIYPKYEYSNNCGGVLVQYYLAKILDEIGIRVRIKLNNNYIPNEIYNNYDNGDFDLNETIVIYGETIEGNPLNASYVVRWILAEIGIICSSNIYKTWGLNDLVYYFNSELKFLENKDKINIIYKKLSLLFINPIFNNLNQERSGYCHTFRKNNYHKNIIHIHPQDSFEVTRLHKQEDYINIFNKYEYFVSYDPLTFLNIIAGFCGCISIIYPINGISKKDWLKMTALADYVDDRNLDSIYGIAYGYSFKEILYAYSTMSLMRDQWIDINNYFKEKYIYSFLKDINNINDYQNIIKNIFY